MVPNPNRGYVGQLLTECQSDVSLTYDLVRSQDFRFVDQKPLFELSVEITLVFISTSILPPHVYEFVAVGQCDVSERVLILR